MIHLLLTWLLAPLVLARRLLAPRREEPRHILLIQTAKIGDYICTTPLVRVLRTAFPEARLSLLVAPLVAPLAHQQPSVDSVFTLPAARTGGLAGRLALYRLLRREGVDTTICLSPNQTFLLVPFLAGVARRASVLPNFGGRSYRRARPFLTSSETHRQGRMTVETGAALLHGMGIQAPLPAKEIQPAPGAAERVAAALPRLAGRGWLGLGVSSGNKLKELGEDNLLVLLRQCLDITSLSGIVLVGSDADSTLAAALVATTDSPRIVDATGRVALADLAALMDRLDVYVGVDSGISYLADARGVPVVDVMGPADPEDQRPSGKRAIIIRTVLDCAPCSHAFLAPYHCKVGTRACVRNTRIDRIAESVRSLLVSSNDK